MPAGQIFILLPMAGSNGSYASQLSTTQRWMVIHYIKIKQGAGKRVQLLIQQKNNRSE
jgi:hypothetical protein